METIEREELKSALDGGADLKLVMAMHQRHFEAAGIPGSIQLFELERAAELLGPDDHVIVYCRGRACSASRLVGQKLIDAS